MMRSIRLSLLPLLLLLSLPVVWGQPPAEARTGSETDLQLQHADDPATDYASLFRSANGHYEAGEYEEAIRIYERIAAAGVREADLFYNLGNSYFKQGDMGRSVLNYKRALRLSPRDPDYRSNIQLVQTLLKDKQFVEKDIWIVRAVTWLQRNLSLNESLLLASGLYLLLAVIAIGYIFFDTAPVSAIHGKLYLVSPGRLLGLIPRHDFALLMAIAAVLFLAAGGLSLYKVAEERDRSRGVITAEEVPVYSAPSEDSVLQFRIHAGTAVRMQELRRPWVRINLPGGLSGWIPADAAESI